MKIESGKLKMENEVAVRKTVPTLSTSSLFNYSSSFIIHLALAHRNLT